MATLTGKTIAATYTSLLKLEGDSGSTAAGGSAAVQVKTGDDDATPLYLNTNRIGIGTTAPTFQLDFGKADGGTLSLSHGVSGATQTITDGDELGTIYFTGHGDGHTAAVQVGAMIRGESGGAWNADQLYDAP